MDLLRSSRLKTNEQEYTLDTLRANSADTTGEIVVLRQAIRRLVADPRGWFLVWGPPGNAKTLAIQIIVAELCRRGRVGRYYLASEVDTATKPPDPDGEVEGSPAAFKSMAKRVDVLAIDEMDKLAWTPWQVQHIGEILDDRHRSQALTLFAANLPPESWGIGSADISHLASRFRDGRHRMIWAGDRVPLCLSQYRMEDGRHYIPGVFQLTVADVRPNLPAKE